MTERFLPPLNRPVTLRHTSTAPSTTPSNTDFPNGGTKLTLTPRGRQGEREGRREGGMEGGREGEG